MKHIKKYHKMELSTDEGGLLIEGPVSSEHLATLEFHEGLNAFRPARKQKDALVEIAKLPEGRIIIARKDDLVVGYVTFLHPDPMESWSDFEMEDLIELGAIEIAAPYRNQGVSKALLKVAFMDPFMENYIVFTTEYYWHWDLKGTGLDIWEYRKVMEKMMGSAGLKWEATDDPEICAHPANCLMVRIGKNVPMESVQKFDRLRMRHRYMY
ncbi:MAG: GNAT family N-acetyltransferase [Bacillaceae bacterium]|nr:GNAT family N-acetyltransferase [Bacillaceae bacterium]